MKVTGLTLLLALATTVCRGQLNPAILNVDLGKDILDAANRSLRDSHEYTRIMGSLKNVPGGGFYTPDWLPGTVVLANGRQRAYKALRYNLVLRALEVRDSALLPTADVASFRLAVLRAGYRAFETHYYQNSQESGARDFFEVLNPSGALRFFVLHQIGRSVVPAAKNTSELNFTAYSKETHFFVLRPGQQKLSEFVPNRKRVLKLFGDRAPEMENYAESNHLAFDSPQDVVNLTDHYNRLTAKAQ